MGEQPRVTTATGIGSWPGEDIRTPLRVVRDVLGEPESDGTRFGLPYLPEVPGRGPGSDMIGRAAGLLVELPVDLQPSGWRFVDHPGRDAERTHRLLRGDLDEVAEVFDGYTGPFKIAVAGPWTLAATVRLHRGERSIVDEGARRDLAQSLAEGIGRHVADVRRLLPGAEVIVQLDEPLLPSVLAGSLPTSSGFGRIRAVEREDVRRTLADVVDGLRRAGVAGIALHCCAPDVPVELVRGTGVDALALDVTLFTPRTWERVAEMVEAGVDLWAGVDVTEAVTRRRDGREGAHHRLADPLMRRWGELGLDAGLLDRVTITPTCGLASSAPADTDAAHRVLLDASREIHWRVADR